MSISPLITFKAGQCQLDSSSSSTKVKPLPESGYIYLYSEDDLIHFCWRKRSSSLDEPELDLVMIPTDGTFVPYEPETAGHPSSAKTNGRVFVLKFSSSSTRYLFWMQSKPQAADGDASWFSPKDRKIGQVVNSLLQGEEVDVRGELANVTNTDNRPDDDEVMEDAGGQRDTHNPASGGAGAGATGGDVREEGEESREGGADGARAVPSAAPIDAAAAVRNFLASLGSQPGSQQSGQYADKPFPHLTHLLPTSITVPMIDSMATETPERLDILLAALPPTIIVLAKGDISTLDGKNEPSAQAVEAARASMSIEDKKVLLKKVLRSPQFSQGLGTLTQALHDGGLPSVAGALNINVENGGYLPNGTMPLGGGQAVEAFIEGVKKTVQEK